METLKAIAARKSTRSFKSEQIPEAALQEILKAGMAAPVGSNAYDTLHLTVIQDPAYLNELGDAVTELVTKFLGKRMNKNFGAPTMIIVSAKQGKTPGMELANAATVLENMAIAATSMGIDNIIWGGAAAVLTQNEEMRKKLELPKGLRPVLAISLGYGTAKASAQRHSISINRI